MGVMPFLAACHACVLMLYCIAVIVCYDCSFQWQIKFSLSLYNTVPLLVSSVLFQYTQCLSLSMVTSDHT